MLVGIIIASFGLIILAGGINECLCKNSFYNTNNYSRNYLNNIENGNIEDTMYYAEVVYPYSKNNDTYEQYDYSIKPPPYSEK